MFTCINVRWSRAVNHQKISQQISSQRQGGLFYVVLNQCVSFHYKYNTTGKTLTANTIITHSMPHLSKCPVK